MSAKKPTLRGVDYLAALREVVIELQARGIERTQLSRYELDVLNDSAERGVGMKAVADWVIKTRKEPRFGPMEDNNMGDETVMPERIVA